MKNFEERRNEYYLKLRRYTEEIKKLAKEEKNKDLVNILLVPENEIELRFGNAYITFMQDSSQVAINAAYGNLKPIDLDDSVCIQYLSEIINLAYNNPTEEEMKKLVTSYTNLVPQFMYELVVLMICDMEGFSIKLGEKCNIDFDDELELMRFQILTDKASKLMQAQVPNKFGKSEDLEAFIAFANQFHDICINGIKDISNEDISRDEDKTFIR